MALIKQLLKIREKLANNQPSIGTWVQIGHPTSAEILSSSGSFDWVCIDLEHSPISMETCESLIRAIENSGSVPLVRLTSNDSSLIKRVMDCGALGIIVPMVCNHQSLKDVSNSMHYPPRGTRGVGLARAQDWGNSFETYKDEVDSNTLLIAQIEHQEAVENIDEIFGSGLLDAYIIGPYDLSASFGFPGDFEKEEFKSALEKVRESASLYNIPSGYHLVETNQKKLSELVKEGYVFIAYSTDTIMLTEAVKLGDK